MVRDTKPILDRDPARAKLAAAIALEAGARRDLQVAEEAAELAASRHWEAEGKLEAMRNAAAVPHGGLADDFIAPVASGTPCDVAVLGRTAVEARAKMAAVENEVAVWKQTGEECDLAVKAKAAEVANARERVERAAREVITTPEVVGRLMAGIDAMQAALVERRIALRFILFKGINGELAKSDYDRIEDLLKQDGLPRAFSSLGDPSCEYHPAHIAWSDAFQKLLSDADVALPNVLNGGN